MCIPRATVSAVSCLAVPAFICIDLLISRVLKVNDDDPSASDTLATLALYNLLTYLLTCNVSGTTRHCMR